MNGGTARLGRAAAFAASSVSLSWIAHVAGGAGRPGLVVTLGAFGLLTRLAFGLGSRERGFAALMFGVTAAQLTLHVAFLLAQPHTGAAQADVMPADMMHTHVAQTALTGAAGMPMAPGAGACVGLPASQMLLAHAVAGLLVALSLRRAERVLWSASRLLPMGLVRSLFEHIIGSWGLVAAGVAALPPALRALSACRSARPCASPLGRAARRRGPPILA
ncbi:MFS transporter [Frankia sp. AiPs1]|uniref:hypothetical protein n=1 Tax=Frankia sp. AiPa1 TaxID=573492 RepID=UPI00202B14A8|nr:hypothetical protein [Frankia sp. AiPa1]MCL9760774.1 hypothetical protein [Frankia sp. AiPa1]